MAQGMAALTQKLQGLNFPANKQQVLDHIGRDAEIQWTQDRRVNLRDIIQRCDQDRFQSVNEVTRVVSEEAKGQPV